MAEETPQLRRIEGIDPNRVPKHIACVMDGNGRWAEQQGLKRTEGHRAGEDALFDAIQGAIEVGVEWFTVYAFSTENWRRPKDEVKFLMNFTSDTLYRRRDELNDWNVRIRFIGRRNWRVPKSITKDQDIAHDLTVKNTGLTFTIAFNYGGRAEIVDAVQELVEAGTPARKITEKAIARQLYDPQMPDPDLVIRTSGESRTSNFLLWQIAYSELMFLDILWPDFRREHLWDAIREFQNRDRRFGGLADS